MGSDLWPKFNVFLRQRARVATGRWFVTGVCAGQYCNGFNASRAHTLTPGPGADPHWQVQAEQYISK